jgi:hypothetical protein
MALIFNDFTEKNGLVFCNDISGAQNNAEILYLTEAQKLSVDAVFFRRFYDENISKPYFSEPAVCIFNKSDDFFNTSEHIELHASLWSAGKNEIYIIKTATRIDIINARKPAELIDQKSLSLENLILASSDAISSFEDHRFSAYLFGSGSFWEQRDFYDKNKDLKFFKNKLEEENMPYHQLLTFLKQTRKYLKDKNQLNLNSEIIDKLLIICILIKYLEELKNADSSHTLTQIYESYQVSNFSEALSQTGKSISILEELGKKLNGKIFDYFTDKLDSESDEDFTNRNENIKSQLRGADLSPIANLLLVRLNKQTGELEFEILTKQLKLDFNFSWQQYSFRYLPIELISSIYEHFLQEDAKEQSGQAEKGVVYTPPFLVNFLIDEVMPLEQPHLLKGKRFKVLDPSCGSGVFLVSAYKRILQWWIINYFHENQQLPDRFEPKDFQELLELNIYGVDINKKATLITVFSLTISFLDKLDPVAFWENLDFDRLQNNIKTQNFFEWSVTAPRDFDRVVGNPPFNVPTEYKDKVREYVNLFITPFKLSVGYEYNDNVPDLNLALFFLEFAIKLSKDNVICLIIPANVIMYSPTDKAISYRGDLITRVNLEKIFDFTHLRRILFKRLGKTNSNEASAEPAVSALVIRNKPSLKKPIQHIVIKRLNVTEKKTRFEIDYYDRHLVKWDWAADFSKQFIWKTNLLGGGRLFQLIYRLSLCENLEGFIKRKQAIDNEWIFQDGYKNLSKDESLPIIDYIYNQDVISKINNDGTFEINSKETAKRFLRPRPENLYKLPLLLFHKKVGEGILPIGIQLSHTNKYLVFNSSFCGIHSPKNDEDILVKIYNRFKSFSDLYLLWILTKSPSALIGQETAIKKNDLETIPFPEFENDNYLKLSNEEVIIQDDVLNYYRHLGKSIKEGNDGFNLHRKVDIEQLKSYSDVFIKSLNNIYAKNEKAWQVANLVQTPLYSICQVGFGKKDALKINVSESLDDPYKKLIEDKTTNSGSIYKRILRIYKHIEGFDYIFLVKPHSNRYWLNSIALKDADDTFLDFKKAGF